MRDWLDKTSKAVEAWQNAEILITGIITILVIFGVVVYAIHLAVMAK